MPNAPTPNLGLTVPTVGSDINTWGNELNNDLAILDTLAISPIINVSSSYAATVTNQVEQFIRVTTGALVQTITLPNPAICPGKIFNVKKVDSGLGSVSIVPAAGTIDGQASWLRNNQYSYVRVASNGVSYDVWGNN